MKITHPTLKVQNKKFIIPQELGSEVKFDEKGEAEVSQEVFEYMLQAGFEAVNKIAGQESENGTTQDNQAPEETTAKKNIKKK